MRPQLVGYGLGWIYDTTPTYTVILKMTHYVIMM
jgi:hypothetical protein